MKVRFIRACHGFVRIPVTLDSGRYSTVQAGRKSMILWVFVAKVNKNLHLKLKHFALTASEKAHSHSGSAPNQLGSTQASEICLVSPDYARNLLTAKLD